MFRSSSEWQLANIKVENQYSYASLFVVDRSYYFRPQILNSHINKKVQVNTPLCIWIWFYSLSLIFVTDNSLDWMIVSNCLQMHARQRNLTNRSFKDGIEIEMKWSLQWKTHFFKEFAFFDQCFISEFENSQIKGPEVNLYKSTHDSTRHSVITVNL